MNTLNLEQVKEHFKYAKEVRCLGKKTMHDITKCDERGIHKFMDYYYICIDGLNVVLADIEYNELAEILTYIFDRGEEVIVWDEDGKEYIKPFVTFDLLNNPVVMTGEKDATSISFKHIRKLTPESLLEPQLTELKKVAEAKEMNCTITVIFEQK